MTLQDDINAFLGTLPKKLNAKLVTLDQKIEERNELIAKQTAAHQAAPAVVPTSTSSPQSWYDDAMANNRNMGD